VVLEVNKHPVTTQEEMQAQWKPGAINVLYIVNVAQTDDPPRFIPQYAFVPVMGQAAN
jgi:hypothetical protein